MQEPVSEDRFLRYEWFILPILIVAVAIVCHGTALNDWWLYDDPQILLHALRVPSIDTLAAPEQYQLLAAHTFTPLLPISFKIDLIIGGVRPAVFYAHQLFFITLGALLLFALLKRYVPARLAFLATVIFLAAWPTVYAARTLMIRHYVEGLAAALAALVIWSRRDPDRALLDLPGRTLLGHDLAAAFFYFIATVEKELYAPLPLLLIVQSRANGESARTTAKRLLAPAVAAAVYIGWRAVMLDSAGGYATDISAKSLLLLPWTVLHNLTGGAALWAGVPFLALLVVAIAAALFARRGAAATVLLALLALVLLPLLPLAGMFEWRYAFAAAAAAAAGIALGLHATPFRGRATFVAAIVALLMLVATNPLDRMYERHTAATRAEGKYIWEKKTNDPILLASSPSWYLSGLRDLRRLILVDDGPRFVSSETPLLAGGLDPEEIVRFDAAKRNFTSLASMKADLEKRRKQADMQHALTVLVSKKDDAIEWKLEGPGVRRWFFVLLPEFSEVEVPPSGSRRVPEAGEERSFRIRAELDNGQWTITPDLLFPEEGKTTRWRRR